MTIASTQNQSEHILKPQQVDHFHQQGDISPFTLCSEQKMAQILNQVDEQMLTQASPFTSPNGQSRHLAQRGVWELCGKDPLRFNQITAPPTH